jgi:hypothetical protein
MATLRQYFETDFTHVVRIHVTFAVREDQEVEAYWLVDFLGYSHSSRAIYPAKSARSSSIWGSSELSNTARQKLSFRHGITLPAARQFPGSLTIETSNALIVRAQFFGDQDQVSASEVQMSKRVFIYSETQLNEQDLGKLKEEGRNLGHEVQFRSQIYATMRSKHENPPGVHFLRFARSRCSTEYRDRPPTFNVPSMV